MTQSKVVTLNGAPISQSPGARTPLMVLKEVIAQIESGEIALDDVLVIGVQPSKLDTSKVSYPTWDNDMRVGEAVFLLESVKVNILTAMKGSSE